MPIVGDRGATLILLLILCFVLVSIQEIRIVKANSTIYIRADGSVEGTDKIQRDGNVYTFTGNVDGALFVEKDNVVVDGIDYDLSGTSSRGIVISERNNVTIKNVNLLNGGYGIYLDDSSDCIISDNDVVNCDWGIYLKFSNCNIVARNSVKDSTWGIDIYDSYHNNIADNNVTHNRIGLQIDRSSENVLRNNRIYNNEENFDFFWNLHSTFINDVDASNTIEGKPIIYWINQHDKTVPSNAGYVALVNCTNITVQGLTLANNGEGVLLAYTKDSTISNNNLAHNSRGVGLVYSSKNNIIGNTITESSTGIQLRIHKQQYRPKQREI